MPCPICLKEIIIQSSVLTPCNHRFCSLCFFKWIYTSKTCPCCRRLLIAAANVEEKEELIQIRRVIQQQIIQVDELSVQIDDLIDQKNKLKMVVINQKRDSSQLYTEIEFLANVLNRRKKEIQSAANVQNRARGPLTSRRRRMGQMWA